MAKKYIDAELLLEKINHIEEEARKVRVSGTDKEAIGADGKIKLCLRLKSLVNSLQQEQLCDTCTNDTGCVTCKDGELWEGKEQQEVDLEKEIEKFLASEDSTSYDNAGTYKVSYKDPTKIARHFANWQKEQMLKGAVERTVKIDSGGYPYIDITAELYDYEHDVPLAKEGELVKIIIIPEKEDK